MDVFSPSLGSYSVSFFLFLLPYSSFVHFTKSQIKIWIQWVEIKTEASHSENSSWKWGSKQNSGSRCQIVPERCKDFLVSILVCDFAWWEIKSKFLQAQWNHRSAIVWVRGPSSKAGCSVLGAHKQPALPLSYHMKLISLWQARAWEFTTAVKSQAPGSRDGTISITPPSKALQMTCIVSVKITKSQISTITVTNFLVSHSNPIASISLPEVIGCLHIVSIVIHIPSHWNAPMTLLCGHFSFSFTPRWQNDRMSLSGLQEFNELLLKCFPHNWFKIQISNFACV